MHVHCGILGRLVRLRFAYLGVSFPFLLGYPSIGPQLNLAKNPSPYRGRCSRVTPQATEALNNHMSGQHVML